MNLDTTTLVDNLKAVLVFTLLLGAIATPIGFGVAVVVRRMLPMATVLLAAIAAGYVVGVVVIFALIRAFVPDETLNTYATLAASVVVSAGVGFGGTYIVRRAFLSRTASLSENETFAVFGEDVRNKPKSARRHKKR